MPGEPSRPAGAPRRVGPRQDSPGTAGPASAQAASRALDARPSLALFTLDFGMQHCAASTSRDAGSDHFAGLACISVVAVSSRSMDMGGGRRHVRSQFPSPLPDMQCVCPASHRVSRSTELKANTSKACTRCRAAGPGPGQKVGAKEFRGHWSGFGLLCSSYWGAGKGAVAISSRT